MNDGRLRDIVIVGGGSAGWMTAAYLSRKLPELNITLIESSDVPTVGVGEATISTFARFLQSLNLKDEMWMSECDASFKYQIRFRNWHSVGDDFWHPFESLPTYQSRRHLAHYWYRKHIQQPKPKSRESLYSDCFLTVDLSRKNLIPRQSNSNPYVDRYRIMMNQTPVSIQSRYAWHFDAARFGQYLKKQFAVPSGIRHVVGTVDAVKRRPNGDIESITTQDGQSLCGDLFIDCTGFRSRLLGQECAEEFISFDETLFCDKAIALSVSYLDPREELEPITTADARSNGWVWNIPLFSRRGTGYVYCSDFQSPDEAETEFRRFLGEDRVDGIEARHLNMPVGRYRRSWVNNCVAIGLSSGFVEPLESTGLHLVYASVIHLANLLAAGTYHSGAVASFNSFCRQLIEEARDFVAVHYALTAREDTDFWRRVKYETTISEELANRLADWTYELPQNTKGHLFGDVSWACILNGMNYLPGPHHYEWLDERECLPQFELMKAIQKLKAQVESTAVNHYDYLTTT